MTFAEYVWDHVTREHEVEDAELRTSVEEMAALFLLSGGEASSGFFKTNSNELYYSQQLECVEAHAHMLELNDGEHMVDRMTETLQKLCAAYFATGWDQARTLVEDNKYIFQSDWKAQKRTQTSPLRRAPGYRISKFDAEQVVQLLKKREQPFVLFITAPFCRFCKSLRPKVASVAHELTDSGLLCVEMDGTCDDELRSSLGVSIYPTLLGFPADQGSPLMFPQDAERARHVLESFCEAVVHAHRSWKPPQRRFKSAANSKDMREISHLERHLRVRREYQRALDIFGAFGDESEVTSTQQTRDFDKVKPRLLFLGGGMAAGKSTIAKDLRQNDPFWREYGHDAVLIEADALKKTDPLYVELMRRGYADASHIVHPFSTESAELLFLSALRFRRDIVYDGTLTWPTFVKQTVQMVRDTSHNYKRGPGFNDKGKEEVYWVCHESTKSKPAYQLELIGVTVAPEIAVRRGLLRWMSTGRGVPLPTLLRSHKMFAEHFESYLVLFDVIQLYDKSSAAAPTLIAEKTNKDATLVIHDQTKYLAFQQNRSINIHATGVESLYI